MKKKLLFYNIFVCKGDEITNYPIHKLIDDLIARPISERFKNIKDTRYKINAVEISNREDLDRHLWFCKYRDDKPFVGNTETDNTEPIDSDVVEPTLFTYISNAKLLVMGYNHFGPSYRILEEYLNTFIKNKEADEEAYSVRLIPVKSMDQMELIKTANHIKSIDIEFRVVDNDYQNLLNGEFEDKSIVIDAMKKNAEVSKILDLQIGNLSLKKGKFRTPINLSKTLSLLGSIQVEDDIIKSVKVTIKDAFGKHKVIDIKHNGVLYYFIDAEGNNFDYLRNLINEQYYDSLDRPAYNEHTKYEIIAVKSEHILQME